MRAVVDGILLFGIPVAIAGAVTCNGINPVRDNEEAFLTISSIFAGFLISVLLFLYTVSERMSPRTASKLQTKEDPTMAAWKKEVQIDRPSRKVARDLVFLIGYALLAVVLVAVLVLFELLFPARNWATFPVLSLTLHFLGLLVVIMAHVSALILPEGTS